MKLQASHAEKAISYRQWRHVWVQVPRLFDTNGFIYAYWCRSGLAAPAFTTNGMTWSEGFGGVWHCHDTVTHGGKQRDASPYRSDATFYDANASSAAGTAGGAVGYATRLSGDADYLEVANSPGIRLRNAATCEIWARSGTATWNEYGALLSKRDHYVLHPEQGLKTFTFYRWNPAMGGIGYAPTADLTAWHYYAGTYDATATRVFMDGVRRGSAGGGPSLMEDTGFLTFGRDDGWARYLNGWVDEARVSHVARSTNWIWATWSCMASNASFLAYGPVDTRIQNGALFMLK